MRGTSLAIYTVILILVTAAGTKYFWPNVELKIETEEKEVVRTDVRTIIREVERKDGTKERETTIIDRTKRANESSSSLTKLQPKNWSAHLGAHSAFDGQPPQYSLLINRRILGPFFVGLSGNTDRSAGLHFGAEF